MITQEDIKQALYELETIFGVPFKDLPITLLHEEDKKAYTTYEGIYITDNQTIDR